MKVQRFSSQYFAIQHKYNLKKTKMKSTLTIENLNEIYNAMIKIKPIDRSDFFNDYLDEVQIRINSLTSAAELIKNQINKDENLQNL
jgi:hypothetical protein